MHLVRSPGTTPYLAAMPIDVPDPLPLSQILSLRPTLLPLFVLSHAAANRFSTPPDASRYQCFLIESLDFHLIPSWCVLLLLHLLLTKPVVVLCVNNSYHFLSFDAGSYQFFRLQRFSAARYITVTICRQQQVLIFHDAFAFAVSLPTTVTFRLRSKCSFIIETGPRLRP